MCRGTSGILSVRAPLVSVHLVFELIIEVVSLAAKFESLLAGLQFGTSACEGIAIVLNQVCNLDSTRLLRGRACHILEHNGFGTVILNWTFAHSAD